MISLSHNFIFIHVPKTGGTAIQNAIASLCIDRIYEVPNLRGGLSQDVPYNRFHIAKHHSLFRYQERMPEELFKPMRFFACIRNPWDRLISVYFSAHRQAPEWDIESAKQTLRDEMHPLRFYLAKVRCKARSAPKIEFWKHVHYLMKYEDLDNEMKRVSKKLGFPYIPLKTVNVSQRGRDYRPYYNAELRDLVARKFHDEIQYGGYDF